MGITIGVDLAAQPRETAACTIRWDPPLATVRHLAVGLPDAELLALVEKEKPEKVAIDAPFGWPVPFVKAVADYEATGRWTGSDVPTLRLRATDRAVIGATGQQPLSVSSDRIAITAMRCARLLTILSDAGYPVSRDGAGLAAEVYPAAALRSWGFDPKGYKGSKPEQVATRASLIEQFASRSSSWLALDNEQRVLVAASDHLFDALICAVLARAIASGNALPLSPSERAQGVIEGWIHLPLPGSLSDPSCAAVS